MSNQTQNPFNQTAEFDPLLPVRLKRSGHSRTSLRGDRLSLALRARLIEWQAFSRPSFLNSGIASTGERVNRSSASVVGLVDRQRHGEGERRAVPHLALDPDSSAVEFDKFP